MRPGTEVLIDLALAEDAGCGDLTSEAIFSRTHASQARIVSKSALVICGLEVARQVFERVDPTVVVTLDAADGDRVERGATVLAVSGPTIALLIGERTALNFLQRLSGIATLSRQFADTAEQLGTGVRIVDTRKTTPGWRSLEKYAVRCGGCFNHRFSLSEHVLIKDNHIAAAGSLAAAVERARHAAPHVARIEVEAGSLDEVGQALAAAADVIMLDNMNPGQIQAAVDLVGGRAIIEVSGNVRLDNLADYALAGVDVISVGALTHSATAADLSMKFNSPA